MTDREVVITHLDDLRLFADVTVHPVVSPDNWDVYSSLCDYIDQIKTEVEILLREQEPKPMFEVEDDDIYAWSPEDVSYYCPRPECGKEISYNYKFCPYCGQAVKLDA